MIELMAALALHLQQPDPRGLSDCRFRPHQLRSAPPPPAFSIQRFQSPSQERTTLSAYRCPDGNGWRVDRSSAGGNRESVLGDACPAIVEWVEAAALLPIPPAALAPVPKHPPSATWFVLSAQTLTSGGYRSQMEVTLIERPAGPPEPLAAWARVGEALFGRCHVAPGGQGQ